MYIMRKQKRCRIILTAVLIGLAFHIAFGTHVQTAKAGEIETVDTTSVKTDSAAVPLAEKAAEGAVIAASVTATKTKTTEQEPSLEASEIFITEGSTKQIVIRHMPTDALVTYNISDTTIAAVSEDGWITAEESGTTKVSVTIRQADKTYDMSLVLNILKSSDSQLILKQTEVTLGAGETWNTGLELVPVSADDQVTYTTDNAAVAQVNSMGVIKAKAAGSTLVKASLSNGNCILCTVTVESAPQGIKLPAEIKTLKKGSKYSLKAVITSGYSNSKLYYKSNNEAVASVDPAGIVKAVKAGTAKITVTAYNGIKATIIIRVADKIGSFTIPYLTEKSITLAKDQSRNLNYRVSPSNISNYVIKHMIWSSDNTEVADVDQNGKVTAKDTGKAVITLSTDDGSAAKITLTIQVTSRKKGTNVYQSKLSIVDTSKSKYNYKEMAADLTELVKQYGDRIKVSVLANSYDKRHIYQVILGNPNAKKKIMIQSAIHGREYMTSLLTMRQIEFYCRNYYCGTYQGKYFSELFDDVAYYIVPMANPDGVAISQYGASGINNKNLRAKVIKQCKKNGKGQSAYYTKWKSNARGVNLNRNFNAYWYTTRNKSSLGYKGKSPVSELETKALVKLFTKIKPNATISYHATGSIIYWDYGQKSTFRKNSYSLAKTAKTLTSYTLVKGFSKKQSAGFSDWVSIKQKTRAITIEIGENSCPLKIKEFRSIWSKNKMVYAAYANKFS